MGSVLRAGGNLAVHHVLHFSRVKVQGLNIVLQHCELNAAAIARSKSVFCVGGGGLTNKKGRSAGRVLESSRAQVAPYPPLSHYEPLHSRFSGH